MAYLTELQTEMRQLLIQQHSLPMEALEELLTQLQELAEELEAPEDLALQ
jgi:hypothetical protein